MAATNPLALSYLQHILTAVSVRDRSAPYRTFFDNWFAFERGGPFLNASSRPHWYNNPCPSRHGEALRRAHFISTMAARTLAGLERKRLVKDHVIPVAVLRDLLFEQQPRSIEEVRLMMQKHYRIGILAIEEDESLSRSGLRSKMPGGWMITDSPFARYESAGIVAQDVGLYGNAVHAQLRQTASESGYRPLGRHYDNG
ncbi:hypothetical protein [Sphingomonas jaspsi]|uniref:hypothetical protein n=1 Tax=Sphingomonas jaspsi TaxID=392409 RepID=UPI0005669019|nr:hypothetical protein [Sphingomonas jaspsi]